MSKEYEIESTLACVECDTLLWKGGAIVLNHETGDAYPLCVKHFKEAVNDPDNACELWVRWGWAMNVV